MTEQTDDLYFEENIPEYEEEEPPPEEPKFPDPDPDEGSETN